MDGDADSDMTADHLGNGCQQEGQVADPVDHRGAIEIDAGAGIDPALPVQGRFYPKAEMASLKLRTGFSSCSQSSCRTNSGQYRLGASCAVASTHQSFRRSNFRGS